MFIVFKSSLCGNGFSRDPIFCVFHMNYLAANYEVSKTLFYYSPLTFILSPRGEDELFPLQAAYVSSE